MNIVNLDNIKLDSFWNEKPFPHAVIDNFFTQEVADAIAKEFPSPGSSVFNAIYDNPIEIKQAGNHWDKFPPMTYKAFFYLSSHDFTTILEQKLNSVKRIYADYGLHGGGYHTHPTGGKLNVHLDYSIHPKLGLQRKYNIIVYINPNYQIGWGGELGLWASDSEKPTTLEKVVEPVFNRAVLFETTVGWHGLEVPNKFPEGESRNSLAIYYLIEPDVNADPRPRALFAPSEEQKNDKTVLEFIKERVKLK